MSFAVFMRPKTFILIPAVGQSREILLCTTNILTAWYSYAMSVGVPTKREPYLHPVNVAGPLAGVYQELRQSPRNEIPSITRNITFFLVFPAYHEVNLHEIALY